MGQKVLELLDFIVKNVQEWINAWNVILFLSIGCYWNTYLPMVTKLFHQPYKTVGLFHVTCRETLKDWDIEPAQLGPFSHPLAHLPLSDRSGSPPIRSSRLYMLSPWREK